MRKPAIVLGVLFSSSSFAQSSGIPWANGRVLTAPMMQQFDAAKMNLNSLGKPGFAAKLDAQGRIDAPVVGDVSQARATADGKTVSQIGQMADGSVQQTDINAPNGVGGLDDKKNSISPILSPKMAIISPLQMVNGKSPGISSSGSQTDPSVAGQDGDAYIKPGSLIVGGQRMLANGEDANDRNTNEMVAIRSKPDGMMDNGCVQSAMATPKSIFSTRAAISTSHNTPQGQASYGSMDSAVHCNMTGSLPATLTLENVTFGAKEIDLATPLTQDQLSQLHTYMYVATNVIDPTIPQQNPSADYKISSPNYYVSALTGWSADGSKLYVTGWTVLGANKYTANAIPQTTLTNGVWSNLDTRWSSTIHTVPTVYIGAPTQTEGANTLVMINPDTVHNSLVHTYVGHEYDFSSSSQEGADDVTGIGLLWNSGPKGSGNTQALLINGNWTNGIVLGLPTTAREFSSTGFLANGAADPDAIAGSTQIVTRAQNYVDTFRSGAATQNLMRMTNWLRRDADTSTGVYGWSGVSEHFGLWIDPDEKERTAGTGTLVSEIVFAGPNNKYGLYMCPKHPDGDYSLCTKIDVAGNLWSGYGAAMVLNPTGGGEAPQFKATNGSNASLTTTSGNGAVLNLYKINASILQSNSAPSAPVTGHGHYACIDDGGTLYKSDSPCVN